MINLEYSLPSGEWGIEPRNISIGDLLRHQEIGLCTAMKWFAPAHLGVVIVDGRSPNQGEWRYLREYEFQKTMRLSKGEKNDNNRKNNNENPVVTG